MKAVNLWVVCPDCGGRGFRTATSFDVEIELPCPCNASGQVYDPKVLDYLDSWMMSESIAVNFLEGLVAVAALREEE